MSSASTSSAIVRFPSCLSDFHMIDAPPLGSG
jgi:hypothetical protein